MKRALNTLSLTYQQTKKSSGVRSGDLAASFLGHTFLSSFLQKCLVKGHERHESYVVKQHLAGKMLFQGSFQIRFSRKCPTIHNNLLFSLFNCQSNIGLTHLQSEWHSKLLFFIYSFDAPVSPVDFLYPEYEYSECSQSPIHEKHTHQKKTIRRIKFTSVDIFSLRQSANLTRLTLSLSHKY